MTALPMTSRAAGLIGLGSSAPEQRLRRRFVLPVGLVLAILLLQSEQSRFHARMNGVPRRELERANHSKPPVAPGGLEWGWTTRKHRSIHFRDRSGSPGFAALGTGHRLSAIPEPELEEVAPATSVPPVPRASAPVRPHHCVSRPLRLPIGFAGTAFSQRFAGLRSRPGCSDPLWRACASRRFAP